MNLYTSVNTTVQPPLPTIEKPVSHWVFVVHCDQCETDLTLQWCFSPMTLENRSFITGGGGRIFFPVSTSRLGHEMMQ